MIRLLNRLSLTHRVILFIVILEILLVVCFAVYNYRHTRHELLKGFNSSLKMKTDDLIKLFKLSYQPKFITDFVKSNEIFALFSSDGKILFKSDNLKFFSFNTNMLKEKNIINIKLNKKEYGVFIKKFNLHNKNINIYIMYGKSLKDVYHEINESKTLLLYSSIIYILLSFTIVFFSVKKGLEPLYKFLEKTKNITPEDFNKEIEYENCNHELKPVIESFNLLLKKANFALKREREFSENVAHELRTPITVIKSSIQTEMLLKKGNDENILFLESLLDDVNGLSIICDALLNSSMVFKSNENEYLSLIEFKNEVNNVIEMLERLDISKNKIIKFNPLLTDKNLKLFTNIYTTRQIITNLLKNALNYGGNEIVLEIAISDMYILCSIRDNGKCIPEDKIEQIFDRFYRIDNNNLNIKGVGLGLSVCKNLATHYEGNIYCENLESFGKVFIWKIKKLL